MARRAGSRSASRSTSPPIGRRRSTSRPAATRRSAPNTETLTFATADPYAVEVDAFATAVLDGTPLPTPIEDALGNLRVIEQIFASAE